ncbi:hypothetical protein F1880_001293 [Penicillium rolfsii]|nr:hypothetical protein F1880_001293 [Penicillium rolfsii]
MTAAFLLPIASRIVAAASGAMVADIVLNVHLALCKLFPIGTWSSYGIYGDLYISAAPGFLQTVTKDHACQRLPLSWSSRPGRPIYEFLDNGRLVNYPMLKSLKLGKVVQKVFPQKNTLSAITGESCYIRDWDFAFRNRSGLAYCRCYRINDAEVVTTQHGLVSVEFPSRFFLLFGTARLHIHVASISGFAFNSLFVHRHLFRCSHPIIMLVSFQTFRSIA